MDNQLEMFADVRGPVQFTVLTTVPNPTDIFTDVGGEG